METIYLMTLAEPVMKTENDKAIFQVAPLVTISFLIKEFFVNDTPLFLKPGKEATVFDVNCFVNREVFFNGISN